jgi:hypothetical protein
VTFAQRDATFAPEAGEAMADYTFERLVAFTFPGAGADECPMAFQLDVAPPLLSCRVHLVPELGDLLHHADQEQAVRAGMLRAVLFTDPKFAAQLEEVRASRPRSAGYVIVVVRGPAKLDLTQVTKDMGDVVVGIDLASKDDIRERTEAVVSAAASALVATAYPGRVRRFVDSVYFFEDGGRPHYVANVHAGNPTISISWGRARVSAFRELAQAAARSGMVRRSADLLGGTVSPEMGRFQRFVTLWTGLEVLVNKMFPLMRGGLAEVEAVLPEDAAARIWSDKAKLADKFALLAARLRRDAYVDDMAAFSAAKRARDTLMHSGKPNDQGLPVETVLGLLAAYLSSSAHFSAALTTGAD